MKVCITGASGTLGTEVLSQLRRAEYDVYGLTRNEHNFKKMESFCTPVLGDIRDLDKMIEFCDGADLIYHFAALKHVDIMEENPEECIKTNLQGTRNILKAQKVCSVPRLVFTSTDKAVYPINAYGLCKAMSEKLVLSDPMNVVCRYGNVIGSNGSIFHRLPEILRKTNTISITDRDMTRFWIKIKDAASFVIAMGNGTRTGVCIPEMKAAKVITMLKMCAELHGFNSYKIKDIGLRPGEKIHEDLKSNLSSYTCEKFTAPEMGDLLNEISDIRMPGEYGAEIHCDSGLYEAQPYGNRH